MNGGRRGFLRPEAGLLVLAVLSGAAWTGARGVEERPSGGAASAAEEADYVLGVEDRLTVVVWKEPDLTRTVVIRPDGKISLPLAGEIEAAGRSPKELTAAISEALARYIRDPVVTVVVEEINNFKVYVLGEVRRPGELLLRRKTRLLQAIALAGGLTEFADKSNVQIIRREGSGREVRIRIDYRKLASGERPETNLYLEPGDTIVVN